uniref:Uncharacterized protein n=1 Tax=Rhizophora mucronata TaxID=61149 RepID=A0A2P2NIH6_RHIMU
MVYNLILYFPVCASKINRSSNSLHSYLNRSFACNEFAL